MTWIYRNSLNITSTLPSVNYSRERKRRGRGSQVNHGDLDYRVPKGDLKLSGCVDLNNWKSLGLKVDKLHARGLAQVVRIAHLHLENLGPSLANTVPH